MAYEMTFTHELMFLAYGDLRKSVQTLMDCEHPHYFAVKQESPLSILVSDSGLSCVARTGVYYIPNLRE